MKLPLSAGDLLFQDDQMRSLRARLRVTASKAYLAAEVMEKDLKNIGS